MILSNHGVIQSGKNDYIANGSVLALSSRKIVSNYNSNFVTVKRSSDNTSQSFGIGSEILDPSAITSFVPSGNGFVTTWFDQSGNSRNATSADLARIVDNGVLQTVSGKPGIVLYSALSAFMSIASPLTFAGNFTIIAVFTTENNNDGMLLGNDSSNVQVRVNISNTPGKMSFYADDGTAVETNFESISGNSFTSPSVCAWIRESNTIKFYQNQTNLTTQVGSVTIPITLNRIGRFLGGAFGSYFNGRTAEIIAFNSAIPQTELFAKIANQRAYFGF